ESKIKKDFLFFEQHLSGVRSFKMAVLPGKNRKINDLDVLTETEKLHEYLKTIPEVGIVFSPVTEYKTMNKIFYGGAGNKYRLPKTQREVQKLDVMIKSYKNAALRMTSIDNSKGIISAQIKDIGSKNMELLNNKINRWIRENIDSEIVIFKQTGISFLFDKSNNSLKRNMVISLVFAFVIVSLIMALLFKNIKLLIISLIPNVFPLLIAAGVMGFTGLIYNASTAVVFTIGYVIAVDNTIHFLSRFRIEFKRSSNTREAIRMTFQKTGKAIILTSIILFFGFLVLFRSELKGVFAQGVLFCSIAVSALYGDVLLLPVLIYKFFRK
ncbi:MAG TPA: MMPL family transporter, partial [Bacteroidales bacterium]|nr:MMPL family transporter [Bacteroidales bacterium]